MRPPPPPLLLPIEFWEEEDVEEGYMWNEVEDAERERERGLREREGKREVWDI